MFPHQYSPDPSKWMMYHVGSTATCNPPPTNTDIDFLVYFKEELDSAEFYDYLIDNGWKAAPDYDESFFVSLKQGNLNILLTTSMDFLLAFYQAAKECKKNNLMEKKDRIATHEKWFKSYGVQSKPAIEPLSMELEF